MESTKLKKTHRDSRPALSHSIMKWYSNWEKIHPRNKMCFGDGFVSSEFYRGIKVTAKPNTHPILLTKSFWAMLAKSFCFFFPPISKLFTALGSQIVLSQPLSPRCTCGRTVESFFTKKQLISEKHQRNLQKLLIFLIFHLPGFLHKTSEALGYSSTSLHPYLRPIEQLGVSQTPTQHQAPLRLKPSTQCQGIQDLGTTVPHL